MIKADMNNKVKNTKTIEKTEQKAVSLKLINFINL